MCGWPKAPLAVDFGFVTTKKQPAGIAVYPKHYQDLLEPRGRPDDAPPFLYRDDRQIKMLFVRCWHAFAEQDSPHITLSCQPRRHAVADLEAAYRLGYLDQPSFDDDTGDVDDFLPATASSSELTPAWADYLAHEATRSRQEELLRRNDRTLTRLLVSHAASLVANRPDPFLRKLTRLGVSAESLLGAAVSAIDGRKLLDMLIQVRLPSLPVAPGDGDLFVAAVRHACDEFVHRHPFLRPLVVPLRITLLVVPPSQGKDLDNIVLAVMAAVNDAFVPHLEPWLLTPLPVENEEHARWRDEALRRLRSTVDVGVSSYQVLELARTESDGPEGTLTLVLGHGENMSSIWDSAAHYVDDALERDD